MVVIMGKTPWEIGVSTMIPTVTPHGGSRLLCQELVGQHALQARQGLPGVDFFPSVRDCPGCSGELCVQKTSMLATGMLQGREVRL